MIQIIKIHSFRKLNILPIIERIEEPNQDEIMLAYLSSIEF